MSRKSNRFAPEVRDRAVCMVGEHRADYPSEWAALTSIAGKNGCTTETLRRWCRNKASRRSAPAAQASNDKARLKLLEREVKELRRANEILRNASAYFAQADLDRRDKWWWGSSTPITRTWGSSRSAANWQSPHRPSKNMPPALLMPASSLHGRSAITFCAQIERAHAASFVLYGTPNIWHQLRREGNKVAKCTVERLMRAMGLGRVDKGVPKLAGF